MNSSKIFSKVVLKNDTQCGRCFFRFSDCLVFSSYSDRSDKSLDNVINVIMH